MSANETKPLSKDTVGLSDGLLARSYLVTKLDDITEFAELHKRASRIADLTADYLRPLLANYFASMSAEGRGAFALSEGPAANLYDEAARLEARGALDLIESVQRRAADTLWEIGRSYDYLGRLKAITEPLGVPEFENALMVHDMERWGMHRLLADSGPIAGPYRDLLEAEIMRLLTDQGPAALAQESIRVIQKRMKQKASPLTRHLGHYNLSGRIDLWIDNVVFGKTYDRISMGLQKDEQRIANGDSPYEWVRTQIKDANHVLGVKRKGRPPKGGALAQWKLMLR